MELVPGKHALRALFVAGGFCLTWLVDQHFINAMPVVQHASGVHVLVPVQGLRLGRILVQVLPNKIVRPGWIFDVALRTAHETPPVVDDGDALLGFGSTFGVLA